MNKKGYVYLVGAGPGDPGLFTLKGKQVLGKADVVVYDHLVGDKILSYTRPQAEKIYVGKKAGHHALAQDQINELLVHKAKAGKIVVRLKGGDPFLFGRGGEEAQELRQNDVDFEIVPGVTSAIAVPAYAGIPVTHREVTSSLAIITGHEKPGKEESSLHWQELASGIGTLVFLMGVENLPFICGQLIKYGRDPHTPVALIRWGTLPAQEVLTGTLSNIASRVEQAGFRPPAVIVIGDVVNLRDELMWVEKKPLWGKRIVITRARAQASLLAGQIIDLGGEAIEFPSIFIKKEDNLQALYNAFNHLDKYDWIIFTSVNAVAIFFGELTSQGIDVRDLKGVKLCAIGPATSKCLQERGIKADIVPNEYRAEGILEELRYRVEPGQWVLLPRARGARNILPDQLRNLGVHVNEIFLYEAVAASQVSHVTLERIKRGEMDYLTFTSSSTVTNFAKIIGEENISRIDATVKIACIGPITADTALRQGFKVDVMADEYTIEGLIKAIITDARS